MIVENLPAGESFVSFSSPVAGLINECFSNLIPRLICSSSSDIYIFNGQVRAFALLGPSSISDPCLFLGPPFISSPKPKFLAILLFSLIHRRNPYQQ